jgi:hypothetical protein
MSHKVPASDAPRLVLQLSSFTQSPPIPRVPPHQPTRLSAPAKRAIDIKHIYIANAGTPGGAADWIVNDIEVDGRSQLALKDLPGAVFGTRGIAVNRRAATAFSFEGLDPVEHGRDLTLVVTYVGLNPEGVPFYATAVGVTPPQRPTVVTIATRELLPMTKTTISAHVQNAPFQIDLLEIDDGSTAGGAADWIVLDLRIDGRTQFVSPGDMPGDMFASAIDSFVKIGPCPTGSTIELDVTYIGLNPGEPFVARLEGTVTRPDYSVPPPDLHVLVRTSGQGLGDEVIATCDWRAPATDDRAP